jgi:hypothetical protein
MKFEISKLAIYSFFEAHDSLVKKIIAQNDILEEDYTKYIYHLCYSVYLLLEQPFDVDFLRKIKRIRLTPVDQVYKEQAVDLLKQGINYIKNNPVDYRKELAKLYDRIYPTFK